METMGGVPTKIAKCILLILERSSEPSFEVWHVLKPGR